MEERRGRDESKNMYEGPMDMDNDVGIVSGSRRWAGEKRENEGKIGKTVID